jgi:hypothetical protein
MTAPNQDTSAWRKRVDTKLNVLTKGHQELNDRLDVYTKSLSQNTEITKSIDKKIDDLILRTAIAVEIAARAKWTAMAGKTLWRLAQRSAQLIGMFGVALLTVLTFYWVTHSNGSWGKAFINIFNGNLN